MKEYYYVRQEFLGAFVIDVISDPSKIVDKSNVFETYEEASTAREKTIQRALNWLRDMTPEPKYGTVEDKLKEFEKKLRFG